MKGWRIGALADATGVTVRTLHHYDQIGLLRPPRRPGSGYREYGEAEVRRLHQILSLRQLGLSLEEIGEWLDGRGVTSAEVIERHLASVRRREVELVRLRQRLERLLSDVGQGSDIGIEEFIETMEMMSMFEKYYTPEQLAQLEQRAQTVGQERIREVEAEWPRLMEEVRVEMEKGTAPSDPRVQELARRWRDLVAEFTGGDAGIERSLGKMYQSEEQVHGMQTGPMREMGAYIQRAMEG